MGSYKQFQQKHKIATYIDIENINRLEVIPEIFKYLENEDFIPCPRKVIVSKITRHEELTALIKDYCLDLVVSYKRLKKGKAKKAKEANHNNADFRYYLEVLDCFYKEKDIDAFCIVTSDDDYTELILKLKHEGKYLIGVGNKENTSLKYRELFDEFLIVEDLLSQANITKQNQEAKPIVKNEPVETAPTTVEEVKEEVQAPVKDAKDKKPKRRRTSKAKNKSTITVSDNQPKPKDDEKNVQPVEQKEDEKPKNSNKTREKQLKEFLEIAKEKITKLQPGRYNLSNITSDIKKAHKGKFNIRISAKEYEKIGINVQIDGNDKSNAYFLKEN